MRKIISPLVSIGVLALAAVLFAGPLSGAIGRAPGPSGYHVIKTIPVGGEGFWDYLAADSTARRLYISRGTHVQVRQHRGQVPARPIRRARVEGSEPPAAGSLARNPRV